MLHHFSSNHKNECTLCFSHRLMFIYIGADFKGYISQVTVWGRVMPLRTEALSMYADPFHPSSLNLLMRWSDYHLSDNLQARVIHPSIVQASQTVCDNGQSGSACLSSQSPGKLGVMLCPSLRGWQDTPGCSVLFSEAIRSEKDFMNVWVSTGLPGSHVRINLGLCIRCLPPPLTSISI